MTITATPARVRGGKEASPRARFSAEVTQRLARSELRGVDMDRQQYERAVYNEPDPTPAWLRPLYVCGCGFTSSRPSSEAFTFVRVPHACRIA